uniref:Uncharacterized protein n=1 Tax=Tetranychus urticae TaxID=32264 RepID=T1L072_TETUR
MNLKQGFILNVLQPLTAELEMERDQNAFTLTNRPSTDACHESNDESLWVMHQHLALSSLSLTISSTQDQYYYLLAAFYLIQTQPNVKTVINSTNDNQ